MVGLTSFSESTFLSDHNKSIFSFWGVVKFWEFPFNVGNLLLWDQIFRVWSCNII